MSVCVVSGLLLDGSGQPLAGVAIQFQRVPLALVGFGGDVIAGGSFSYVTSPSGYLVAGLVPGQYVCTYRHLSEVVVSDMSVPEAPTAVWADLLPGVSAPLTPSMVQQAIDARDEAVLYEGVWLNDLASLLASSLTYGDVDVGDYIRTRKEGFAYTVAASGATGHHIVTAGGVKLDHVKGPYVIVIAGQSNAAGANADGPNPASPIVKTWDAVAASWGGSDRTALPWTRSNPNGNGGNNNYALARAHRIAEDTGRPVYIVFDAVGGTSIDQWVAAGASSARFVALKGKVLAALSGLSGKTAIDELIWAQGEEDFTDDFATHLGNLVLLRNQLRLESWCGYAVPIYMMGPSPLHDRYQWQNAMQYFCGKMDARCVFVSSNGLRTDYQADGITSVPGAGDFTHFKGESLWEAGFYRIAAAAAAESAPVLFYGRGTGPATQADPTALATFSSLVSKDSWTAENSPNAVAATGSISWGFGCSADGNYTFAFGYQCLTDNASNYTFLCGRDNTANANGSYSAAFGFQNAVVDTYAFAAGRGHIVADSGGAAFGRFSEYTADQSDAVLFQVGKGSSAGARSNGLAVRASGIVEAKGLPVYANNAAALSGGLVAGQIYKTSTGELRITV